MVLTAIAPITTPNIALFFFAGGMSALTVSKEDEKRVKGMGFLNNRGTDLFSARVLTINGKVTAAQHRCMAEAAEKFGNGNLLYTTRLSVELQGIP